VKLETYLELTKGWRGQLETGFVFDPTTINADRTPEYLSKDVRKPRDQEFEDLSHMNPRNSKLNQDRLKNSFAKMAGEKKRRWLAALKANGGKQLRKPKTHRHGQAL